MENHDCHLLCDVCSLETEPKDAGSEKSSGVVRLNTIRQIIEQVINISSIWTLNLAPLVP